MRRLAFGFLCCIVIGLSATAPVQGAGLTLSFDAAGGALSGSPGSLVGWGFILENTDSNYAVITYADFCRVSLTSGCVTPLGAFTDVISGHNYIYLAPGGSLTQSFGGEAFRGIGSYLINPGAAVG